jgi:hypothetical protein
MTLRGTSLIDNIRIGDIEKVRVLQPAVPAGRFNVCPDGRIGSLAGKRKPPRSWNSWAKHFRDEIGITNPLAPIDLVKGCTASILRPEADAAPLTSLVAFLNTIDPPTPTVACRTSPGAAVFTATGCATCHDACPAGPGKRVDVFLYSDLLLHDMGAGWRTDSCRDPRRAASSGRRRSGASPIARTFCTTGARRTSPRRLDYTEVRRLVPLRVSGRSVHQTCRPVGFSELYLTTADANVGFDDGWPPTVCIRGRIAVTNEPATRILRGVRCAVIAMTLLGLCTGTAAAAGDAVTYWNNVVVSATITGITPSRPNPETAIAAAYMHIAIYDAIVSIDGGYTPFATHVPNAPAGASKDAAAAQAAYEILSVLYPATPPFTSIATAVAAAYTSAINAIPNGQAKTDGINVGHAAAQGLLAKRQNDGFRANVPYTFQPLGPGVYQRTPVPPPGRTRGRSHPGSNNSSR